MTDTEINMAPAWAEDGHIRISPRVGVFLSLDEARLLRDHLLSAIARIEHLQSPFMKFWDSLERVHGSSDLRVVIGRQVDQSVAMMIWSAASSAGPKNK